MDEKWRNNMTTFDRRLSNLQHGMRAAKDEDMKRVWYMKQLDLINQRKVRAYERLQDQARMVH